MRKNEHAINMRKADIDNSYREQPKAQNKGYLTEGALSSLMSIQKTVQNFSSLLANVLHLEVEVVDNHLHRVAGTGSYGQNLGEVPESNTLLLSEVIEKKQEVIIFDSRVNSLCQACQQRESCKERGFVGVPVIYQQRCIGVISLVAINSEQLQHLRGHTRTFIEYIRHISTLLVDKIDVFSRKETGVDSLVYFLAESMSDGVIILDHQQRVVFINDKACAQLKIERVPLNQVAIISPALEGEEKQEFTFCLDDACWRLSGTWHVNENGTVLLLTPYQQWVKDNADKIEGFPVIKNFIGNSAAIGKVKALIMRIASSPSSVMILGESGTGKEIVARAIHRLSQRHEQPFVAINCAAIPENLLESELFGYVKGAFTGAAPGGKKGLIQLASRGTLFLDEIGDMPLTLQARLLRVIESREVMPVGAAQPVPVDIRIISATHQNLQDKIQQGLFREDLYYRLNVIPLYLPPLRERDGDVELLLNHFLTVHARRIGRCRSAVNPDVLQLLNRYHWPGNVRELSNLVEYLINIVPEGEAIDSLLIPPVYHFDAHQNGETESIPGPAPASVAMLVRPAEAEAVSNLKSVEKTIIEEALQRTRNKKQIADELGIGVATLYRKIKKYGLK